MLYSKDTAVTVIRRMVANDRLCHAFILCGEKGVGKKTLAKYMAAQILCERGTGIPCGECKSCRMIKNGAHPDFITVTPRGKTGNYLADDLRAVISDSSVAPNEGQKKIYFLPRIDKALPAAQNVLLKIVEEPPEHVCFIMTAETKEKILPTVLSRAIILNVPEPSEEECREALLKAGIPSESAESAIAVFGGNIGRCLEYLGDDGAKKLPQAVGEITDCIISGDEYALLKSLTSLEGDRELCLDVLAALKSVIRDAIAQKLGGELYSVCRERAKKLSETVRRSSLRQMYDEITAAEAKINGNASALLCLSDLCGRLAVNR